MPFSTKQNSIPLYMDYMTDKICHFCDFQFYGCQFFECTTPKILWFERTNMIKRAVIYMKYLTQVSSSSPSCRTLLISILYLSPISHKLACTSRGGFLLPALGRGNVAGCELSLRGRATGSTTAIYVTWFNCTVIIVFKSGEATCKLPPLIWSLST